MGGRAEVGIYIASDGAYIQAPHLPGDVHFHSTVLNKHENRATGKVIGPEKGLKRFLCMLGKTRTSSMDKDCWYWIGDVILALPKVSEME